MGRGLSLARHPIGCLKCTEGTDVLQEGRKGREGESEDPSTSSGRGGDTSSSSGRKQVATVAERSTLHGRPLLMENERVYSLVGQCFQPVHF